MAHKRSRGLFLYGSLVSETEVTHVGAPAAWGPRIIHTADKAVATPLGHGSLVVKVSDSWQACHEFEPSTAEDPPCRGVMHVKCVESSNVLPLVW
ncbi:hypothetical protein TNCV_1000751 [Trichonephila clavipes]|nr:hypothetical protein TNCV_1000751 [Trichonephila clavipes]